MIYFWMRAPYELCNNVFWVELESFQSDLNCCVEWKHHIVAHEDKYDEEYRSTEERYCTGTFNLEGRGGGVHDDRIRSKVLYPTKNFVAVETNVDKNKITFLSEWTSYCPRPLKKEGDVCTLSDRWYETCSNSKWMTGRYYPWILEEPVKTWVPNIGKIIPVQTQSWHTSSP